MRLLARIAMIFCLLATFFLCACKKSDDAITEHSDSINVIGTVPPANGSNFPALVETKKIWSAQNYSAFTDLIIFKDKFYCAFREAASHEGTNGTLRVLESADGDTWVTNQVFQIEGRDLRDPKFIVFPSGELVLYSGSHSSIEKKITNFYWKLNINNTWSVPYIFPPANDWLWQIRLINDRLMSFGYNRFDPRKGFGGLTFFISNVLSNDNSLSESGSPGLNIIEFSEQPISLDGCATEASFTILPDGRMVVISRRDCGDHRSFLGIASPPYNDFNWSPLNIVLQSPEIIQVNNVIYVTGRNPGNTEVYTLDLKNKLLDFYVSLPYPGDTGYPGIAVYNNQLYISYYSPDGEEHRSIYLAKVRLKK